LVASSLVSAGPTIELRQLLPEYRTTTAGELLQAIDPTTVPATDRPYTIVNFIATADGRAAFDGRSGPISDPGDREFFHGLRERVDAVMAGTGTLRTERYGRITRDPERRERRVAAGLRPEPIAGVISRSGAVPIDIPLFADPEAMVVVFTAGDLDTSACAAEVEVVRLDPEQVTMTTALRHLRAEHGVRLLLCEGGPTVFGALLHEGLVDELFLTISPKLAGGGTGPTITSGPELPELLELDLRWALEHEGTLFLRYATR
jgi:riboflavin-specific deaminase-like protein